MMYNVPAVAHVVRKLCNETLFSMTRLDARREREFSVDASLNGVRMN